MDGWVPEFSRNPTAPFFVSPWPFQASKRQAVSALRSTRQGSAASASVPEPVPARGAGTWAELPESEFWGQRAGLVEGPASRGTSRAHPSLGDSPRWVPSPVDAGQGGSSRPRPRGHGRFLGTRPPFCLWVRSGRACSTNQSRALPMWLPPAPHPPPPHPILWLPGPCPCQMGLCGRKPRSSEGGEAARAGRSGPGTRFVLSPVSLPVPA